MIQSVRVNFSTAQSFYELMAKKLFLKIFAATEQRMAHFCSSCLCTIDLSIKDKSQKLSESKSNQFPQTQLM